VSPKLRARLLTALKAAVTVGLTAWAFSLVDFHTLQGRLANANFELLTASAAILVAGGFAGAGSWFCILRTRLPALTYREVAACHWSGMFFNSFLPSNVGGDVVKGYIVARDQGQTGFVVTSLLLDRVINLGVLLCIGLFALLLQLGRPLLAAAFLALLAALLAAVLASARRLGAAVRRWPRDGLKGRLAALAEPVFELAATPRLLAPTLLAALASQLLKTWQNVFVIRALGLAIPPFCVWFLVPVLGVVSAVPISVGGLGPRELVAQRLAEPVGVSGTDMVLLSLAGHLMVVLVNTLGVAPFLFAKRRRREAPGAPR
jgi:uncharacterized membrane protein YbhN (UPF0104 family)